jgi:hypothetical protein
MIDSLPPETRRRLKAELGLPLSAADRRAERARWADDVCGWLDTYGWTFDPRLHEPFVRFRLFPKQREFLLWVRERERRKESGLCEKSRDAGVTWLCCGYALHGWLFRPGFACGFGSRKLELVDKRGDPKSIFEKIRMLLRALPPWMLPDGFSPKTHDCMAKLLNPENGAVITGEGGDDIGRGDRALVYFVDEAAFLERPQLVERSLSQTTNCRIDVSTPNGSGNPFAEKRFSGRVPVFTFHWRDDPRKDDAWYAEQKRRFDPVTVAQEIDIDYTASLEGICIPAAWVRAAVGLQLPASGPLAAGLDVADGGSNRTVFVPRQGPVVGAPVDWAQGNTTETAHRAADAAERLGVKTLAYDCIGVGAGIRGTFESSGRRLRFEPLAVNVGEAPTETRWPDGRTSKERFVNLRAELWWKIRTRFEKSYEYVTKGVQHPPEEMISIPNHPQLIAELSQPLCFNTEGGKTQLESKNDMRRRGVRSPDYADALALSLAAESSQWSFCTDRIPDDSLFSKSPFGAGPFERPLDGPIWWSPFEDDGRKRL